MLLRPIGLFQHAGPLGRLEGIIGFPPGNSGPSAQKIHRFGKIQPLYLLHKADDITILATGPTTEALTLGVDIK